LYYASKTEQMKQESSTYRQSNSDIEL
jgi:hypothetical protein